MAGHLGSPLGCEEETNWGQVWMDTFHPDFDANNSETVRHCECCGVPLHPHHIAVYCSTQCALADS